MTTITSMATLDTAQLKGVWPYRDHRTDSTISPDYQDPKQGSTPSSKTPKNAHSPLTGGERLLSGRISKILGQPPGGVREDAATVAVAVGNTVNTVTWCCNMVLPTASGWVG